MEKRTTHVAIGFAIYGALGVLAALTLDDWRFRGAVLILLGAMAFKTWLAERTRS